MNLDTLIIVCLVKNVKNPDKVAAKRIKKMFWISSYSTTDWSIIMFFLYSSMIFMEFLIKPGVNNNRILAIITIITPSVRFNLYL